MAEPCENREAIHDLFKVQGEHSGQVKMIILQIQQMSKSNADVVQCFASKADKLAVKIDGYIEKMDKRVGKVEGEQKAIKAMAAAVGAVFGMIGSSIMIFLNWLRWGKQIPS